MLGEKFQTCFKAKIFQRAKIKQQSKLNLYEVKFVFRIANALFQFGNIKSSLMLLKMSLIGSEKPKYSLTFLHECYL